MLPLYKNCYIQVENDFIYIDMQQEEHIFHIDKIVNFSFLLNDQNNWNLSFYLTRNSISFTVLNSSDKTYEKLDEFRKAIMFAKKFEYDFKLYEEEN